MADKDETPENQKRRDFINTATGIVAGTGIATACWPFINSMNPSADVLSNSTSEADLRKVKAGEVKVVPWQGKPVFVLRRTEKQIAQMETSQGGPDPQSDGDRVQNPEWLVIVGICTHLGCVPLRRKDGWFCPCHGSVYDNSGRILKGPAPRNLELPPYEFVSADKIIIGQTKG